jgi:hypothetical protein
MNQTFGAQLRKELLDFLDDMESRPRRYSTGSDVSSEGSDAVCLEIESFF